MRGMGGASSIRYATVKAGRTHGNKLNTQVWGEQLASELSPGVDVRISW